MCLVIFVDYIVNIYKHDIIINKKIDKLLNDTIIGI